MQEHMDRNTLLNLIRNEYGRLDALLAELSDEEMVEPGVEGDWSVKEILAHLADWQSYLAGRIRTALAGGRPERRVTDNDQAIDALNQQIDAHYQSASLHDVRLMFHGSYREVMDAIEQLSDEDLGPNSEFRERMGEPFLPHIAGNTYEHYQEHRAEIVQWLERRRADRPSGQEPA